MFDEPGSADLFAIKEHVGDLVLVAVNGFMPQFPTAFGMRDTIRCSVAVIDSKDPARVGKVYGDAMIFGAKIVAQLRSSMHRVVLGRIALGSAKVGQNAPYQLDKFSQEDAAKANAWVEANGPFEAHPTDEQPAPPQQNQQQQGQGQQQGYYQGQPPANGQGGYQQQSQPSFAGSAPAPGGTYTSPPQGDRPPF